MGESKPKRHAHQQSHPVNGKRKYIPPRKRKVYSRKRRRYNQDFPKGWIHLSNFGDEVANTHIIPLKCPLSHHRYPDSDFTPRDFINAQNEMNRKIGLIIDLTFTTKYYTPRDLPKRVKYIKFKLQGHTQIPKKHEISQFIKMVNEFREQHPKEYIGVHCTHGLNRTGYLIINFLIQECKMTVDEAIDEFARARGAPMHKPLFLDALYENYNQTDSPRYRHRETKYPEIPFWARNNKSNKLNLNPNDESEEKSETQSRKKLKKESEKEPKSTSFKQESRKKPQRKRSKSGKR